jgi:hypothetical protein
MEGVLCFTGTVAVLVGVGALVEGTRYWRRRGMMGRKPALPALQEGPGRAPRAARVGQLTSAGYRGAHVR